ncbi:hypothetical protein L7F22_020551 [Adiantum nelumboides]|nr:hypothetical protein [Adiantum nelumboides]
MAAASASSGAIAAVRSSNDGQFASSSKAPFFPAQAMLGGRRLSSSPSTTLSSKFGSVLSVSTTRRRQPCTPIRALDPDFYKIPYVEGIPVGNRLKLWNLPPNCDQGELREWLDSIPDVNVTALEFTDDPELNAQGVGGFVEYTTKQEACMAIVRLDGRKLKGRCIRMDFVEKRPHERDIGGRRNRPSRNYPRDRSYSGGSYSGGNYAGNSYAGSGSGAGMYGGSNFATTTSSGNTFDASTSAVSPNWAAPSPSPPPPPPPPRAYGPAAHRIFVGNLSWNMDDNGLLNLFRNHEEMNAAIRALDGAVADGRPLKTAQHKAKVKELEQELAQAKAELEMQRQRNEALSKEKEAVGSLASTSQISQAKIHLHVHIPPMPDMPNFLGTSHHEEEQQGPAPGALNVRGDLEQNVEDMCEGPAKEFLLHEKIVMELAALAYLQPEEQAKGFGNDFLPLPLMNHEAIL